MPQPATSAPASAWAWRLMITILLGMVTGFFAARALGFGLSAVEAAIVCALTFTAGGTGPIRTAVPVAAVLGLVVVPYSTLGAVTTGYPLASALAMAFVAFTTTVMTVAKPVGLLIGMVASMAYFMVTAVGVLEHEAIGRDMPRIGLLGLVGLVTGLVLVVLRASIEQALGTTKPAKSPNLRPPLLAPMVASVRTFDATAKDGVRRAIALGLTMYAFQAVGGHNAFWVMLTVFVILQPNGRSTVSKALGRSFGTLVGVVALVGITQILPESWELPLAVVALAVSLALTTRSTRKSAAFRSAAAAILVGLPSGDFIGYGGARLVDTIVGSLLALAAGYLLWPRQQPTEQTVPDDLAGAASSTGFNPAA